MLHPTNILEKDNRNRMSRTLGAQTHVFSELLLNRPVQFGYGISDNVSRCSALSFDPSISVAVTKGLALVASCALVRVNPHLCEQASLVERTVGKTC